MGKARTDKRTRRAENDVTRYGASSMQGCRDEMEATVSSNSVLQRIIEMIVLCIIDFVCRYSTEFDSYLSCLQWKSHVHLLDYEPTLFFGVYDGHGGLISILILLENNKRSYYSSLIEFIVIQRYVSCASVYYTIHAYALNVHYLL